MPSWSSGGRSTCTTTRSRYACRRDALSSRTPGLSLTASAARGVVVQGPVGSRRLARWRVFRYEVRRWRDGVIADADEAVASPQPLSDDPRLARRLLDLVGSLPTPVWGRDELGTGEMWNSNSVISWLLARSGLPTDAIHPPAGGRAPGWAAGLVTALREPSEERTARHGSGATPRPWQGPGSSDGPMRSPVRLLPACSTDASLREKMMDMEEPEPAATGATWSCAA